MHIGDIELIPLSDGTAWLPPEFYVGLDFSTHGDLLASDGRVHIPIGCYLIRTSRRTVLLDAGMGPVEVSWGRGGHLPDALRSVGVEPADIDTVVCTHLHRDHVGWLVQDGEPFFPKATVLFGAGDWDRFVTSGTAEDGVRDAFELLDERGRLESMEGDMISIAPGVTARATPGHTEGHYGMVVASGEQRAYVLGDAVECPLQVEEPDFYAMSDVDPDLANRTRERLWKELEGSQTLVGAAHFPDLQFGRILPGAGKRYFTASGS